TPEETEGVLIHELGNQQWNVDTLRKRLFDVLMSGALIKDFEISNTFPEIGDRTLLLSAKRIEGLGSDPQRILLMMEDVTERKKSEEALVGLAAIVTSSDDAIVSLDLEGCILTWNDGAARLLGYEAEEVLGREHESF